MQYISNMKAERGRAVSETLDSKFTNTKHKFFQLLPEIPVDEEDEADVADDSKPTLFRYRFLKTRTFLSNTWSPNSLKVSGAFDRLYQYVCILGGVSISLRGVVETIYLSSFYILLVPLRAPVKVTLGKI